MSILHDSLLALMKKPHGFLLFSSKFLAGKSLEKGDRHITTDSTMQMEYQCGESKIQLEYRRPKICLNITAFLRKCQSINNMVPREFLHLYTFCKHIHSDFS